MNAREIDQKLYSADGIESILLLILKVIYTKMNKTGKEEIDKAKKLASLSVAYILRLISEGKNDEQTAERFDGNSKLVKDRL